MSEKVKKLILIDGNAIIHRAYHALPPLTNKKGELLNAVYGFSSTILSVIDKFQPDYMVASFDLAAPTFRHKEFKEYKAHRVKADQELYDQIPRVKEVTRAMGVPILEKEGFEADDVIGTLTKISEKKDGAIENIIVTGDLDTLQLVSGKTKVYTMRRGLTDSVMYDSDRINERYGLKPEQLIDFKGFRGDPSDNIPGVKGVGEKTASDLLQKYSTLENVYKNIGEIKGALKDKLERDKVQAIQSKKLATIVCNVPVKLNLEEAKINDFDREKLVSLFQELNFYSLIKRIPDNSTNYEFYETKNNTNKKSNGAKDFSAGGGSAFGGKYEIITESNTDEFIEILSEKKKIAFVIKDDAIAFSWKTGRAVYIDKLKAKSYKLKAILENKKIKKIRYDLKGSIKTLKNYNIDLKGKLFDVMLAAYVLAPGEKTELPFLVLKELGEEIKEDNKKGQLGLDIESVEEKSQKLCAQVDYIGKLQKIYTEKIKEISA